MITDGEWSFARSVVDYIGLTPATYCFTQNGGQSSSTFKIDVLKLSTYIVRKNLELDLERMAWVRGGRVGEEPSTPKSRGESVQEWLYTQVHRSDLGYRACDMVLAVMRLSLRHAVEMRQKCATDVDSGGSSATTPMPPIVIELSPNGMDLIREAGIPLDPLFLDRCEAALREDIALLPLSFPELNNTPYLNNIVIER